LPRIRSWTLPVDAAPATVHERLRQARAGLWRVADPRPLRGWIRGSRFLLRTRRDGVHWLDPLSRFVVLPWHLGRIEGVDGGSVVHVTTLPDPAMAVGMGVLGALVGGWFLGVPGPFADRVVALGFIGAVVACVSTISCGFSSADYRQRLAPSMQTLRDVIRHAARSDQPRR